jgi:hypothetical protein
MKPKEITITRGYKKSGNFNTISGSVSVTYILEGNVEASKAFEKGKTEVDSLLKDQYDKQEDWMNKMVDKLPKADLEGYR